MRRRQSRGSECQERPVRFAAKQNTHRPGIAPALYEPGCVFMNLDAELAPARLVQGLAAAGGRSNDLMLATPR